MSPKPFYAHGGLTQLTDTQPPAPDALINLPGRDLRLMVALLRDIEAVGRNNSRLVVLLRDVAEFRDEAHRVMLVTEESC